VEVAEEITCWNVLLNTSTVPALKFAAYKNVPWSVVVMARPL